MNHPQVGEVSRGHLRARLKRMPADVAIYPIEAHYFPPPGRVHIVLPPASARPRLAKTLFPENKAWASYQRVRRFPQRLLPHFQTTKYAILIVTQYAKSLLIRSRIEPDHFFQTLILECRCYTADGRRRQASGEGLVVGKAEILLKTMCISGCR